MTWNIIPPRSGVGFILKKGQVLLVKDPEGQQVADLFCFNQDNPEEALSSGRTIDYNSKIYLSTGDDLYSDHSHVMLRILKDDVGVHDFLYTPCNRDTFKIIYGDPMPHTGCHEHLIEAFTVFDGINPAQITTTFNVFMNVALTLPSGALKVLPPLSKPGDIIAFQAQQNLIMGLTACSAGQSNNFVYKPIHYQLMDNCPDEYLL